MRNPKIIHLLLIIIVVVTSCKEVKKSPVKTPEKGYSIDTKTTTINWIAYKTTSKIPVKGQFTKVNIDQTKKSTTALEALNGLKFDIPVSSLFTKDTIRDGKLKKFFFGTMRNTIHS